MNRTYRCVQWTGIVTTIIISAWASFVADLSHDVKHCSTPISALLIAATVILWLSTILIACGFNQLSAAYSKYLFVGMSGEMAGYAAVDADGVVVHTSDDESTDNSSNTNGRGSSGMFSGIINSHEGSSSTMITGLSSSSSSSNTNRAPTSQFLGLLSSGGENRTGIADPLNLFGDEDGDTDIYGESDPSGTVESSDRLVQTITLSDRLLMTAMFGTYLFLFILTSDICITYALHSLLSSSSTASSNGPTTTTTTCASISPSFTSHAFYFCFGFAFMVLVHLSMLAVIISEAPWVLRVYLVERLRSTHASMLERRRLGAG